MFNLVKCICILQVAWSDPSSTLCILGDAIASFLKTPDKTAKGLGVASRAQIVRSGKTWANGTGVRVLWKFSRISWRHAVSARRWAFVLST